MSKSLHNLYRFLLHFFPPPSYEKDLSSFVWHEIFPECIDCLIKTQEACSHSPFLCCFPLISWAYLFVCETHTANAKDLFAAGKTISVTHLFSWSFFRASLLGWNVQQKCSSTLLMHSWAKSQRKQNLNILETIFHIWNPLDVFILGSSIWLCFDVMGNEKERFIDSQKSLWCWENNRQLLAWGIFVPLHICVAETATRTLRFGGAA